MKIKTLFISDVHLFTNRANADKALSVLRKYDFDKLVIIGDLFDFWALKRKPYFNISQLDLLRKLLKIIVNLKEVIYIRGNHDEGVINPLQELIEIPNFHLVDEYIHYTIDKKIICIHGHQWDMIVTKRKWLALLGDRAYSFSYKINKMLLLLGFNFSLSNKLKGLAKKMFLGYFIECAESYRERKNADIIMCGHTHNPYFSATYINTGDFVDNCSYVVENIDGSLELKYYV